MKVASDVHEFCQFRWVEHMWWTMSIRYAALTARRSLTKPASRRAHTAAQPRDLIRSWKDSSSGSATRPSADSLPAASRPSSGSGGGSANSVGPEMSHQSSHRNRCSLQELCHRLCTVGWRAHGLHLAVHGRAPCMGLPSWFEDCKYCVAAYSVLVVAPSTLAHHLAHAELMISAFLH